MDAHFAVMSSISIKKLKKILNNEGENIFNSYELFIEKSIFSIALNLKLMLNFEIIQVEFIKEGK